MPPQARTPPADHPVFIWPTPEEQDLLFYVERDGRLPKYQSWTYGTAHDDATAYPNHKLVHVSPQDGKNWTRWYYAADKAGIVILQDMVQHYGDGAVRQGGLPAEARYYWSDLKVCLTDTSSLAAHVLIQLY